MAKALDANLIIQYKIYQHNILCIFKLKYTYIVGKEENMWPKIQKILNEQKITANCLSVLMGSKNNTTIYALKNGEIKKPSFELMEKIADALEVSLDEFRTK